MTGDRRVRQYCYVWLASATVTAAEITAALGMEPDRTGVRGSKRAEPSPVPVEHSWKLVCDRPGGLDQQAADVLGRIEPVAAEVRRLVDRGDVAAGLMMVRYRDVPDGGDEGLGWALEPAQVALLAAMGAQVQVDEYAG